jgi:hypothetical protein
VVVVGETNIVLPEVESDGMSEGTIVGVISASDGDGVLGASVGTTRLVGSMVSMRAVG